MPQKREHIINSIFILVFIAMLISFGFVYCNSSDLNSSNSINNTLSDSLATPETVAMFNKMMHLSSNYVMVGHQDALAYGLGWVGGEFNSDIYNVSGDHPAIFGWDLGHVADSVNIDQVPFVDMKNWAKEIHRRGGINTYGWHAKNLKTNGSSWDVTPCIANILPKGDLHDEYLKKLDLLADFFQSLVDDNGELIPVLFRPFHVMIGGWFWWGAKSVSSNDYKKLWRFSADYLRNERKLNNIIYIYSTDVFESKESYLEYYPGDVYVDILGYDDYKGLHDKASTPKAVKMIEDLADLAKDRGKLYTISETGLEAIPDSTWFTNIVLSTLKTNKKTQGVSYVLFWRNGRPDHFYAPYLGHNSQNDFKKFKADSLTVFLSDLQNLNK